MNMQLTNQSIMTPGEHAFVFEGLSGSLQGRLLVPNIPLQSFIAILGHPHSLQGGTMNNKVVTTMARAFATVVIASLRFNFRGVEGSEGIFDNGPAESDDMLVLARLWSSLHPDARMIFAGFSFGSYVTYRAAAQWPHELLISIAPPVERYDYAAFSPHPSPWHIVLGDADEVVDVAGVLAFSAKSQPAIPLHLFSETGHFFHGKLIDLKATLIDILTQEGLAE